MGTRKKSASERRGEMSVYRIERGEVLDFFSGRIIKGKEEEAIAVAYTAAIARREGEKEKKERRWLIERKEKRR